jgi:hypothetical protein
VRCAVGGSQAHPPPCRPDCGCSGRRRRQPSDRWRAPVCTAEACAGGPTRGNIHQPRQVNKRPLCDPAQRTTQQPCAGAAAVLASGATSLRTGNCPQYLCISGKLIAVYNQSLGLLLAQASKQKRRIVHTKYECLQAAEATVAADSSAAGATTYLPDVPLQFVAAAALQLTVGR